MRVIKTPGRFRAIVRLMTRLVLTLVVGSWLFLYFDSVYQRRRVEALFADLKSLDFATAGFPEVRDIMNLYGGKAIQWDLVKRSHESPGTPRPQAPGRRLPPDARGNVTFQEPPYTCTPLNCTFRLSIMTQLPRIPILGPTAVFLYTTLPYIGIRSWTAFVEFDVKGGKLYESYTGVAEYRMERVDYSAYRQFIPRGYAVETRRDAASFQYGPCSSQVYQVWVSHGYVKVPENGLHTCVVQSAGASVKRAFDVHLRCLNNLFRNCRFDEIAPSAWADYTAMTAAHP